MRNTGKPAEEAFDSYWASVGKLATVYDFEDASDLFGQNKKLVRSREKPCDRILIFDGIVSFCEVKSTHDKTSFSFGQLQRGQINYATKITAARGRYDIYVWSYATRHWYVLPWVKVAELKAAGRSSIKWTELEQYKVQMPEPSK